MLAAEKRLGQLFLSREPSRKVNKTNPAFSAEKRILKLGPVCVYGTESLALVDTEAIHNLFSVRLL